MIKNWENGIHHAAHIMAEHQAVHVDMAMYQIALRLITAQLDAKMYPVIY